jgi:hypothetical protein
MKTTNQSGNEQNVTNLEVLIAVIITFGPTYNPPKPSITIPGLNELLEKGKLEINALNAAEVASKNALAACTAAQDDFDSLITRSINALRISDVPAQTLAQAEGLVRELRGKRASALLTPEEQAAAKAEGNTAKQVVKHNSTLESKLENMAKYVLLLESIPGYMPNEPELRTRALRNKLNDIKAKDMLVTSTGAAFDAARLSRDTFLYTDNTGLCPIASDAKTYVKSVFGATSPQYKQVSGIKFFKRK